MGNEKTNDVNKVDRQIYILSLLSENPNGYQAEDIQNRLKGWDIDVSKRTITRDIDELSLNYGICEEERNGKTYYYANKYTLRNVDLTIEDLASLAFAKEMLKGYAHYNMGSHVIALIEKMVGTSTTFNKKQFDTLCGQFAQVGMNVAFMDQVDSKVERTLQNAIENHNKTEIAYYSFSSDETTNRIIHPYRMLVLDGYLCVEGYCELRKEVRRFRLSRIHSIAVSDEKYKEIVVEEKKESLSKLSGKKEEELELVFTGDMIRYVKEYEAPKALRMEEKEDGLHFYQKSVIAGDVIRWIRGFGPEVKVRKPEWLHEQLIEEAKLRMEE